jgi:tetratricopeptide (TPR) repeat protein
MRLDPVLTKASRFVRSGKYEETLRILEPEVNRYHGSYHYYYLLGSACLRTGDWGGALTYFRLAHETKMREPLAILGLAALYLRRGETQRAVDFYLDVLDTGKRNPTAKRAMKVIRRQAGSDGLASWLESGKLQSLYPPVPFPGFSAKEIFTAFAVLLAAAGIAFVSLVMFKVLPNPLSPRGKRQELAAFNLTHEDRMAPVETGGSYRYILTRVEAIDAYEKALALFTNHRDEAARINLNRILESNAADGLKNRARIIISYMEVPGFDTFKRGDNAAYADVQAEPALYNGVHIIWRGMATNVVSSDEETAFDFLVGYDTRKTLEGIVPVVFNQAVSLNPERPLELLARVVPKADGTIQLAGIAIHQSGRLGN